MIRIGQEFSPSTPERLSLRLREALDSCVLRQPVLAHRIEQFIDRRMDENAKAFGVTAYLAVWTAFDEFAAGRMTRVEESDWETAEALFHADVDMRKSDPDMLTDSDEVLAAMQPAVITYVGDMLSETIEMVPENLDLSAIDQAYQMVLVLTVVMSRAILARASEKGVPPEPS